ncbi:hypothetical protein AVEN_169294-1 [Araneus ventricosus]|uniref:Uncharacterized protein n=1 Tax=Araneus ventricosus TaxID=182803 RepID=A0A4Y2HF10_ARAVE|nr:hypothetical protein AVEN_169294-1 [Araneus ventricosus]
MVLCPIVAPQAIHRWGECCIQKLTRTRQCGGALRSVGYFITLREIVGNPAYNCTTSVVEMFDACIGSGKWCVGTGHHLVCTLLYPQTPWMVHNVV